jgi:hypothetical protein
MAELDRPQMNVCLNKAATKFDFVKPQSISQEAQVCFYETALVSCLAQPGFYCIWHQQQSCYND